MLPLPKLLFMTVRIRKPGGIDGPGGYINFPARLSLKVVARGRPVQPQRESCHQ